MDCKAESQVTSKRSGSQNVERHWSSEQRQAGSLRQKGPPAQLTVQRRSATPNHSVTPVDQIRDCVCSLESCLSHPTRVDAGRAYRNVAFDRFILPNRDYLSPVTSGECGVSVNESRECICRSNCGPQQRALLFCLSPWLH